MLDLQYHVSLHVHVIYITPDSFFFHKYRNNCINHILGPVVRFLLICGFVIFSSVPRNCQNTAVPKILSAKMKVPYAADLHIRMVQYIYLSSSNMFALWLLQLDCRLLP